jgi:Ribosomal prokaryotic L21 protein
VTNAVVHAVIEEQVPHTKSSLRCIISWWLACLIFFLSFLKQGKDPKKIIFKYKRKKNYRRTIGHRQVTYYNELRIFMVSDIPPE